MTPPIAAPRFDGKAMAAGVIPLRGEHTGDVMAVLKSGQPGAFWTTD